MRKWMTLWSCLAGPLLLGLGGAGSGLSGPGIDPNLHADSPAVGDPSWRLPPLWDDGEAEVCAYEVDWPHQGHLYKGRALLVLFKEAWNPALDVKAEPPERDSFEVLELDHIRDVAAGSQTYHQTASVFWRRDSGALQKVTATSVEECGASSAEMKRGRLRTHACFDGEGNRERRWQQDAWPEDGLPAALRTLVAGLLPHEIEVFPSLLAGRFADLSPRTYRLERRNVQEPSEPGTRQTRQTRQTRETRETRKTIELRLSNGKSHLSYTFEPEPPHRLLRFERDDGTVYRLVKCERSGDYGAR